VDQIVQLVFDEFLAIFVPLVRHIVGPRPFSHRRTLIFHFIPAPDAAEQEPHRRLKFCCSGLPPEDWHASVLATHMRAEGGKLRADLERLVAEGQMRIVVGAGPLADMQSGLRGKLGCRWRIYLFPIEAGFKINPESFTDWPGTLGMWGFDASGGCSSH